MQSASDYGGPRELNVNGDVDHPCVLAQYQEIEGGYQSEHEQAVSSF